MAHHLVEMEQKAHELKNSGRVAEAAELFSAIVDEQPDWEHGKGFHFLAQCYEDLGRLDLAEKFYRAALSYEPFNDIFLGGLASFLYLYGKPEDAFDAYVTLWRLYRSQSSEDHAANCMLGINALGERMGWSSAVIAEKLGRRDPERKEAR